MDYPLHLNFKMKKILSIGLFLVSIHFYSCNGDSLQNKKLEEFNNELSLFSNSIKTQSIGKGKYNVFVACFYSSKTSTKDFCFTLGYILNEYELNYISPNYVYYLNNDIVLIKIDKKTKRTFFKNANMRKIEAADSLIIIKKLYPQADGGITYTSKGLTYCNKNEKKERTIFENSDEIPFDKSIFKKIKKEK